MGRFHCEIVLVMLALGNTGVFAQQAAASGTDLAAAAMRRFPQPVQVGNLIDRPVLQPLESRPVLGRTRQVVQLRNGAVSVVVAYGGVFGLGSRLIAVPLDAMALLGTDLEIVGFTPEQLSGFPTYDGAGAIPVAPGDTIRVGLARPSH